MDEVTVPSLKPKHPVAWWIATTVAVLAVIVGAACFAYQMAHGDIVTGMRSPGYGGAAWGLYIVFYIVLVGVSFAGITVSALSRLFDIQVLKPATRMAELLTITSLVAGALMVIADLGRPLRGLMYLPAYARPQSPFYGTFTLVVAGYLFSSAVFFFLSTRRDAGTMARLGPRHLRWFYRLWAAGHRSSFAERRRHHRVSFWLSVSILPLLVIAHSTLGFIFGIQSGRPGWFGALQAPSFVILAGVSGTGMLILLLASARRLFGLDEQVGKDTLVWLTNFMATLALVYLYFMVVEELTATYAAPAADRAIAHEVVFGHFAPLFWLTVACLVVTFVVPFSLRLAGRVSVPAMVAVAVLANVAAVSKRLLIVVPSQTHGALMPMESGHYRPSIIEYGVVLGALGLMVAAILLFGRLFPLVPLPVQQSPSETDRLAPQAMRIAVTAVVALAATVLIVVGLVGSFRLLWGELDPPIPYSPVIFASGVMLLFTSAIVYEVFPSRRDSKGRSVAD